MRSPVGLVLIVVGIVLVLVGVLAWSRLLGWFGSLPGDLRVERQNTRIYVPITSILIVSVVLSLLIALFNRLK